MSRSLQRDVRCERAILHLLMAPAVAFALCGPERSFAEPASSPTIAVVGQTLTVANGYFVFTTGDAVKIDPALTPPAKWRLGQTVRIRIDRASHRVVAIDAAPRALGPGDLEAGNLPREFVSASPKSARSGPPAEAALAQAARTVTVTIAVHVPDSTPLGDDVYLATDRTNFAPAEIRMIRIDARTFSAALELQSGARLRYEFTRGNFATIERNKLGGIVTPRTLTAVDGLQMHDTVIHWADIN